MLLKKCDGWKPPLQHCERKMRPLCGGIILMLLKKCDGWKPPPRHCERKMRPLRGGIISMPLHKGDGWKPPPRRFQGEGWKVSSLCAKLGAWCF